MSTPAPIKLSLKRDAHLQLTWPDGRVVTYPIDYLRSHCPCALCRQVREQAATAPRKRSLSLNVLPGDYTRPLSVTSAEMVGNYALRLHWSDNHAAGIYSFDYLREIDPDRRRTG